MTMEGNTVYAVKVKFILPVWGQMHGFKAEEYPPLVEKYGEEAKHLDCFFFRTENPITRKQEILIPGSTVYGAIKVALGKQGVPMKYPWIFGIFVDEEHVKMNILKRTLPNGKSSLLCGEIILPNTTGFLLIKDLPEEDLRPRVINLGKMKKQGYGLVEILWETAERKTITG